MTKVGLTREQEKQVTALAHKLLKAIGTQHPVIVVNACAVIVQLSSDLQFGMLQDYRESITTQKEGTP